MSIDSTGNSSALAPIIYIALFTFTSSLWYLSKFTIPRMLGHTAQKKYALKA